MRERPLLFSAPMSLATLRDEKTQTRRLITSREPITFLGAGGDTGPDWNDPSEWGWFFDGFKGGGSGHGYEVLGRGHEWRNDHDSQSTRCPYGEPGKDRLWVRETWRTLAELDHLSPQEVPVGSPIRHEAGAPPLTGKEFEPSDGCAWGRIRQSIYCMRWMSRTLLDLTDVRVERLQSITESDARAEGVSLDVGCPCGGPEEEPGPHVPLCRFSRERWPGETALGVDDPHRMAFAALWDSLNAERAPWSANPFVWVLGLKRVVP